MTEPTVEQALRVIRKIEMCEGDAAKLILLKNFMLKSESRLREGLRELAERMIKENAELEASDNAMDRAFGRARLRSGFEIRALLENREGGNGENSK